MLSYITLWTGSLVVLLAVVLVYKTFHFIFKSISNFIRPVSGTCEWVTIKNSSAGPQKKSKISNAVHDSLIPLDRRIHEAAWNRTKTLPVDPDPHGNQMYDWLLHERKSALAKDSYTVRRRFTPPPPMLEKVSKPFSHKRAPWVLEHEASKKP